MLYDDAALDAAWDLVKGWSAEERQRLRDEVPRLGFKADDRRPQRARHRPRHAGAGQRAASPGEIASTTMAATRPSIWRPSLPFVEAGRTPAEDLLDAYYGRWNGSVEPVFDEYVY